MAVTYSTGDSLVLAFPGPQGEVPSPQADSDESEEQAVVKGAGPLIPPCPKTHAIIAKTRITDFSIF